MASEKGDLLTGMKAICAYLNDVSESTALKFHRELDMPIRKSNKDGKGGEWLASKSRLDDWSRELVA